MRALFGNIGVRLAIIAVVVVVAFIFRDRMSGSAADLRVGDCFDVPTAAGDVSDVQHHPCAESHTGEVVYVGDHPAADDAAFPSDAEFASFFESTCIPAFNSYTGLDYESDPVLDVGLFTPNRDGWSDGDREMICYAVRIDSAPMTSSLKKG